LFKFFASSTAATIEDFDRGGENRGFAERCQSTAHAGMGQFQTGNYWKVASHMGTSRRITESQLERAKAALAVRVKALQEKGTEAKKFSSDPHWRQLNARVRQIAARLRKVAEVEVNNSEIAKLKVERLARIAAEKAERKAGTAGKKGKPEKEKDAKSAKKEKAPKEKSAAPPKEKTPKEKKEKKEEK
jgi:hypothetical protein